MITNNFAATNLKYQPLTDHSKLSSTNFKMWLKLWNFNVHQCNKIILWKVASKVSPLKCQMSSTVGLGNNLCPIRQMALEFELYLLEGYEIIRHL